MVKQSNAFVMILVSVLIIAAIPIVTAGGVCISSMISSRISDYKFLSEQFSPIFNNVNSRSDNAFSYVNACYNSGHIPVYYLKYTGDGDLVNSCVRLQNNIAAEINSGDHTEYRFDNNYIIKISSLDGFVIFWSGRGSVSAETNIFGGYSEFESVNEIQRLTILSESFTEEQSEFVNSLRDDFPFELYLSDGIPWC